MAADFEYPGVAARLVQRLLQKYKDERESLVVKVLEESVDCDLGDDVTILDVNGSPYQNSPYRIVAYEFAWPASQWTFELANYRDALDRRIAELGEKMRIAGAFGQGATNFYPFQLAENVKGGSRHATVDLTIPPDMVAVNSVKIARLRFRPFENYTGISAGSQTPTSSAGGSETVTSGARTGWDGLSAVSTERYAAAGATSDIAANTWTEADSFSPIDTPAEGDFLFVFIVVRNVDSGSATITNFQMRIRTSNTLSGGVDNFWPSSGGTAERTLDLNQHYEFCIPIPWKRLNNVAGDQYHLQVRHESAAARDINWRWSIHSYDLDHKHNVTTSDHTHDVSIAGHSHPADVTDTTYSSPSVSIFIDGANKDADVKPAGPFTADTSDIDLTKAIDWTEGTHTLELRENTSGKLGRIHASGFVKTFLKST